LAVADGLNLTGTAPILTGTYNLSVVGYIRSNIVYPGVKEGAPTTMPAGGGGGGAPGCRSRLGGGGAG